MLKKNAMRWVKALRSGKFKQTMGKLKRLDEEGKTEGYCCLGVLSEISGCSLKEIKLHATLSGGMQRACGLKTADGTATNDEFGKRTPMRIRKGKKTEHFLDLADANDGGASFRAIATWIEKNYKFL